MFTVAGWGEDIDVGGVEQSITALADDHLFISGDNLRVPSLSEIIFISGGLGSGGNGLMRLESPSLRKVNRLQINPLNGLTDGDVEPGDPLAIVDMRRTPRLLDDDEQLRCVLNSNTSAPAFQWCIVGLADGVQAPVTGRVITVHADGSTTVTARVWSTVALSFVDELPVGRYQVVGLRALGASMISARFIFKPGTWRPGCMAQDSQATMDHPMFRAGELGVWGEFDQTQPPDIEVLCDLADTSQDFELDLIKVGG